MSNSPGVMSSTHRATSIAASVTAVDAVVRPGTFTWEIRDSEAWCLPELGDEVIPWEFVVPRIHPAV
jgi:hypothetical protein